MQEQTININIKKITEQVIKIDSFIDKKKWTYKYDKELDSLYLSPGRIPSSYTVFSVGDEYSLFVNKSSKLGGIFIEYFKNNLTSHEPKMKIFKRMFDSKDSKEKKELFTDVIKSEIISNLVDVRKETVKVPL